eukprot:PITA_23074
MASVSFRLVLSTTITCLLFLASNSIFASTVSSEEKTSSNHFQLHTTTVFDGHVIHDTRDGEVAAEMVDREVDLNFNHAMLHRRVASNCDLFSGAWVHDASYPLCPAGQCPYMIEGRVNCRKNGRPDSDYEKWRWQPSHCSVPRFNAKDMLSRLRGKRLMFVGDSITRSQWESMDYNASVEFLWDPFLVQQSTIGGKSIIQLDSVGENGAYWKGVDVLVFESSHWWLHAGESWEAIMKGNRLYRNMDPLLAYRKGLTTWANWISANLDPKRSLVFYRTTSPAHESSSEWNERNRHRCYNQTEPVQIVGYKPPVPPQVPIVKQVLQKTKFPVTLLDITGLIGFRKDGHPSVYSPDYNSDQRKNPDEFGDCSHWCLPGVPDTWNELLYYSLLFKGFGSG